MDTRERRHDDHDVTATQTTATPSGTDDVRAAAERLLACGAEAIRRALSLDPRAYLGANRQTSGE